MNYGIACDICDCAITEETRIARKYYGKAYYFCSQHCAGYRKSGTTSLETCRRNYQADHQGLEAYQYFVFPPPMSGE